MDDASTGQYLVCSAGLILGYRPVLGLVLFYREEAVDDRGTASRHDRGHPLAVVRR
jgi:hypothetical protein